MASAAAPDRLDQRRGLGVLVLLGLAFVSLCPLILRWFGSDPDHPNFFWFLLLQCALYVVAVWVVLGRAWDRRALVVIVGVAVVARVIALPAPPILSDDAYRYVWDGRVQAAGINPYRYVPRDEHLAALRDEAVYPHINRAGVAPTIYPPAAQLIFLAVTRVNETLTAMHIAMLGFDLVTIAAIIALLGREGRARERVLVYAWHPLPIWEFAGTGHVDAAAIALMCLAMLAASRDRRILTGVMLALSVLVKPFALVISPVLWRRWDWRMPAAFLTTCVACYLPYLGAGWNVLGYLPGYGDEEGYLDGWGFFAVNVLRDFGLPSPNGFGFALFALVVLASLAALVVFRRNWSDNTAAMAPIVLAGAFLMLVSPHYPWYFAWVLPLLCRTVYLPLLFVTLACFLFYFGQIIGPDPFFQIRGLLYGGFGLLVVIDLAARLGRSPIRKPA